MHGGSARTAGLGQLVQSLILAGQLPADLFRLPHLVQLSTGPGNRRVHISAQAVRNSPVPGSATAPPRPVFGCAPPPPPEPLGAAVGLQLDTGGAVLHLLIGRRRRSSLASFSLLLQPGLGIGATAASPSPALPPAGDISSLRSLPPPCGRGQLPPQGRSSFSWPPCARAAAISLLGRLGRLGFRQLPPDGLQLLPVLLVRRLNIIQHILLLKPAKGGRAELEVWCRSYGTPLFYRIRVILSQFPYNKAHPGHS